MFTEETVFILGAGASWHYGYPTGEELISRVQRKANELASLWNDKINGGHLSQWDRMPSYFKEYDQ